MTVTYKNLTALPPPIGLYSHVARFGNLRFFAGMAAIDDKGEVIGKDDLEAQMRAMYAEMGQALKAEELTYSSIVQMTTYLVRTQDIPSSTGCESSYTGTSIPMVTSRRTPCL